MAARYSHTTGELGGNARGERERRCLEVGWREVGRQGGEMVMVAVGEGVVQRGWIATHESIEVM